MAGATFSRFLGFDVISGEDVSVGAASTQSATSPVGARTAILTARTDLRYAVGTVVGAPTAVATGPLLLAGSSIPLSVREGSRIAVIQDSAAGSSNITWCR